MSDTENNTFYVFKGVTLSYPKLWKPELRGSGPNSKIQVKPGDVPVYSADILIPISYDLTEIMEICFNILAENAGGREVAADLYKSGKLGWPLRKDAFKENGEPRFDTTKYKFWAKTWSKRKPGLFDKYAGEDGKPEPIREETVDKLYGGAIVNVAVNAYWYATMTKGVNLGLSSVQHWADGERFGVAPVDSGVFPTTQRPVGDLRQVSENGADNVVPGPGVKPLGPKGRDLANLFNS